MTMAPTRPVRDTRASRPPLALYDGSGGVDRLRSYRKVVLKPGCHGPGELAELRAAGTQPLARLSLSEDDGPPAPWRCAYRVRDRSTSLVHVDDPAWAAQLTVRAAAALDQGFCGLFLDDLTTEWTRHADLPVVLGLVAALRERAGAAYLLANGGFALLPRLGELVDGAVFESFSVRYDDSGYSPWPDDVLAAHGRLAERLLGYDLNLYTLDYAEDEELEAFAVRRARRYGMSCFVTDRDRLRLPSLVPSH